VLPEERTATHVPIAEHGAESEHQTTRFVYNRLDLEHAQQDAPRWAGRLSRDRACGTGFRPPARAGI